MSKIIVLFESDSIGSEKLKKMVMALEGYGGRYAPIKVTVFEEEEDGNTK